MSRVRSDVRTVAKLSLRASRTRLAASQGRALCSCTTRLRARTAHFPTAFWRKTFLVHCFVQDRFSASVWSGGAACSVSAGRSAAANYLTCSLAGIPEPCRSPWRSEPSMECSATSDHFLWCWYWGCGPCASVGTVVTREYWRLYGCVSRHFVDRRLVRVAKALRRRLNLRMRLCTSVSRT